jgi:hypothetical protein
MALNMRDNEARSDGSTDGDGTTGSDGPTDDDGTTDADQTDGEPSWQTFEFGPDGAYALVVLPRDLTQPAIDEIRELLTWCIRAVRTFAEENLAIQFPRLEIWLIDLTEALNALGPRVVGQPVTPGDVERVGGQLGAKTIPLADDWRIAAVASPGAELASSDGRAKAVALFTLLHEIGHTLVERLGALSGAREIGWQPTAHSLRKAGNAVRHGLDEWRVSSMASAALEGVMTDADGRAVTVPDLMDGTYRGALGGILDRVYPGWPVAVERYRHHQISLFDLYAQVVGETVEVFTFLSHCEAEAHMLGRPSPLRDEYAGHPATRLYLGDPWLGLVDCDAPLFPAVSEFAGAENEYLSQVVPKIIEMWRRLGLTFTDGPGPEDLRIDVTAPLWDAAESRAEGSAAESE